MRFSLATGKVLSVGPPQALAAAPMAAAPMAAALQYYRFAAAGPAVYAIDWAQAPSTAARSPPPPRRPGHARDREGLCIAGYAGSFAIMMVPPL